MNILDIYIEELRDIRGLCFSAQSKEQIFINLEMVKLVEKELIKLGLTDSDYRIWLNGNRLSYTTHEIRVKELEKFERLMRKLKIESFIDN